jgi:hypothetical protein
MGKLIARNETVCDPGQYRWWHVTLIQWINVAIDVVAESAETRVDARGFGMA